MFFGGSGLWLPGRSCFRSSSRSTRPFLGVLCLGFRAWASCLGLRVSGSFLWGLDGDQGWMLELEKNADSLTPRSL